MKFPLSQQQADAIYYKCRDELFAACGEARNPRALLFAGQPGSGKSTSTKRVAGSFDPAEQPVVIEFDKLRLWYPPASSKAEGTSHAFVMSASQIVHAWCQRLRRDAHIFRRNIIIESTFGGPVKVMGIARYFSELRDANYKTQMVVLAMSQAMSRLGIFERYEKAAAACENPRWSLLTHHDRRTAFMPYYAHYMAHTSSFDAKSVVSHRDIQLHRGAHGILGAIRKEQKRPWTEAEKAAYGVRWLNVVASIARRPGEKPAWYDEAVRKHFCEACFDNIDPVKPRTVTQNHTVGSLSRA